jgi:UPF0755 protein
MKKLFLIFVLFILFVVTVAGIAGYVKYRQYEQFKKAEILVEKEISITVSRGDSWKKVASLLEEKGLVKNSTMFYWMIREHDWGSSLKTGEFEFSGSLSPLKIAQTIVEGRIKLYGFTIPEGYNKFDSAEVFKSLDWIENKNSFLKICDDPAFISDIGWKGMKSCEGLLFPSTYSFEKGVQMEAVMKRMASQMNSVLDKYKDEIEKSGMDKYEVLKMASLIEKETGVKKEQPLIGSVFMNRRRLGMKYQSDPTVIYGFLPDFEGRIRRRHLVTDHPWSTYTRYGLPATPICFPGEGAIRGVLFPDSSDYLYFVSTKKGYHYFSKSLREHNAAVQHYQIKGLKDVPFNFR